MAHLDLTRAQIIAFRRSVQAPDQRLPPTPRSLRHAAWAGLQDSMPRAALLSVHARVEGTTLQAYVVDARDHALLSLGRLPEEGATRRTAYDLAFRLERLLAGRATSYEQAGRAMGEPPNRLGYAALTGTIRMRGDGARAPSLWTIPAPDVDPREARAELARRYLHVSGPATAQGFATWVGIPMRPGSIVCVAAAAANVALATSAGGDRAMATVVGRAAPRGRG